MRLIRKPPGAAAEADMTPMIDMTFQLIAFFMVLINFTEVDQDQRIHLPSSELAKPADVPYESPITLQLTREGSVLLAGDEVPLERAEVLLQREKQFLQFRADPELRAAAVAGATIVIRADAGAKFGVVRRLIQTCQNVGFQKFALRAKQEEGA